MVIFMVHFRSISQFMVIMVHVKATINGDNQPLINHNQPLISSIIINNNHKHKLKTSVVFITNENQPSVIGYWLPVVSVDPGGE